MRASGILTLLAALALVLAGCASPSGTASQAGGAATASPPASGTPGASASTAEQSATEQLVQKLRPSVVRVQTQSANIGAFGQTQQQVGVGTGVVIDTQGRIVTNNHVVVANEQSNQPSNNITVTLFNGKAVKATIVGRDAATDLAVLKIDPSGQGLQAAQFADPSTLQVGETVVAIGYALDLPGNPSVTRGVLSALKRSIQEPQFTISPALQTDASINPGNSGGPLVNLDGQVVGINTAAITSGQNIGFAISVQLVQPIVRQLIQNGDITRGFIGIGTIDITSALASSFNLPVNQGVGVVNVASGSPGDQAGLQAQDIIVALAGQQVQNSGDLLNILQKNGPGTTVSVDFYRGSNKMSTKMTLGTNPNE
ncbi:MAG: trypsin-like peptidase domain-containing protein [Dehalococcoidia bacterium]|nr:trypsin-like peptidase domain-containing protein [Dehalococcoidia bacterium]